MNILSVSSILPIPDIIRYNDFIFHIYDHLLESHPTDRVVIVKPVKFDTNPKRVFSGRTILSQLNGGFTRYIRGYRVEIFPFVSTWSLKNLHPYATRSIYWINRKRIKELVREYDFDIIHAQYIFPDGVLARQLSEKFGIPYVITSHNERHYFKHRHSAKSARTIFSSAYRVLPINHANYRFFQSLGVANMIFLPLGFHRRFIREQKPDRGEPVHILTVAVLVPLKNIDKVLEALSGLKKRYRFSYTIIGRGPERVLLEKMVRDFGLAGRVRFIEAVPHEEMAEEMHQYDIFVMPSYFETFGRVYLEAMAMGIPIVCARGSGIHGMFREGEEGLSVNHDSISEIRESIEYLVEHPEKRRSIGRKGKAFAERYTWDRVAAQLYRVYQQAVENKKAAAYES